jgi:hypothetical protein
VQSTLNKVVVFFRKMGHIDFGMLEPIFFKEMILSATVVEDKS